MAVDMRSTYPWTHSPLIVNGPMRLIALAPLAVAVSQAGGLGFLAAGTDLRALKRDLQQAADLLRETKIESAIPNILPIGVGFINWAVDVDEALDAFGEYLPIAVWFFAPRKNEDLVEWVDKIRRMSQCKTQIWIQIGCVADALQIVKLCDPDVLVVQGADAGGHGLAQGASIITLLPEVADALRRIANTRIPLIAAGGVIDGRAAAACLTLGAGGFALGTRFLACKEANIAKGYQDDVLRTSDGGLRTVRTSVYDTLRGTTGWPARYNGRGIINHSFIDAENGKPTAENKRLYKQALQKGDEGWGEEGRLTAYAGSGVGLVNTVMSAQHIIEEIRQDVHSILDRYVRPRPNL